METARRRHKFRRSKIDLDNIAYVCICKTDPGPRSPLRQGMTLTVKESPEDIAMPKKPPELAA